MKRFRTPLGFRFWNEEMFRKFRNERLYLHPNPIIRYVENRRVKIILKLLRAKKTDYILDMGCGEAYIMKQLKGNLIGLDLSNTALSLAKIRLKSQQVDGNLVMGDACSLPFRSGCFNKIICSELLEHIPLPEGAVSEASRVIKRGGTVVFTIPNEEKINQVKRIAKKLRLFKLLFKDVPERMDCRWHLHDIKLTLIKKIIARKAPKLKVLKIIRVPLPFPIRIIILARAWVVK